jgi:hypothetical protein
VQAATRDGLDLRRHPLSMLALGEHGWIQVINFIIAGVLSLIFAVGVARRLPDGPGSTWASRLLALYGAGLVIGGIFKADPASGFPADASEGYPEQLSVHAPCMRSPCDQIVVDEILPTHPDQQQPIVLAPEGGTATRQPLERPADSFINALRSQCQGFARSKLA